MTRVLIAVDGTDRGIEVARTAKSLFGDGAHYLAVNCTNVDVSTPFGAVYPMPELALGLATAQGGVADEDITTKAIDTAAERAGRVALDAGIRAEPVGEIGDPVTAIVHAAAEHHADVIVVGSRSRSWISRLLEPSVAEGVKRASHVPVLFVQEHDASS